MRISILWSELSGYLNACLKTLVDQYQVDLQVFRIQRSENHTAFHPYRDELFAWLPEVHTLADGSTKHHAMLHREVTRFEPELLLISGWTQPAYLSIAKQIRQQGTRVICGGVDNQWQGNSRQWAGVVSARWRLWPYFDALWVTGARSARLAHKLGYRGDRLLKGFYACDCDQFVPIGQRRIAQVKKGNEWPRRFLFTGRLTEEKGVTDLLTAYRLYRSQVVNPWSLWIAGSGPLTPMIKAAESELPGLQYLGFLQPNAYADVLGEVGAFLLPSRTEPWGVVIQEALCAALPVICSRQCGSSEELVHEGESGFTFAAGDTMQLAGLMARITENPDKLLQMGETSFALARRYTPQTWTETLMTYGQRTCR